MRSLILALFILLPSLFTIFSRDEKKPMATVPAVDLKRYTGKWYEIARYPNRFQKQCEGDVTADYKLLDNGKIEVINSCTNKKGKTETTKGEARIKDKQTNAKLEVRFAPKFISFLPFVWGNYWIVELDPNYQYAVVSEPGENYLWILSRTAKIDEGRYQQIIQTLKSKGFDVGKIVNTKQS